ncbi:MAG: 3-phosphoserine/phosphohydroxythreonine transaminase [Pirellulaceae bacterium]|nr:3-phosphoserine/phosphohydroxythreonine transaminase [Pirellulaceae bacterium]MDG2105201.1 3-phosphoserine/phosphohydroxythreonine transaminase [Pirellulaceae bacterium]
MSTETLNQRCFNFSAGPAVLPELVLEQIRDEMLCLPGVGSSVLEISHRSKEFGHILNDARDRFRALFAVPESHDILFLQGGACLQNAMIPANLLVDAEQTGDYLITGTWGKKSSAEAHRFGNMHVAWNGDDDNFCRVPDSSEIHRSANPAFVHFTSNETIQGVQFHTEPDAGGAPLVADMSSDVLCRPVDIDKYGLIYACAQKNSGVAGVTVVVIRKDLLERCSDRLPLYLNYAKHSAADSMANTPPTFAIYVLGLVCKWLQDEVGGLQQMQAINEQKSNLLYDIIDTSQGFFQGHARTQDRSIMNVVFKTPNAELDAKFIAQAAAENMTTLKGHRSLGGIRASIYNAMPVEGVETLGNFMKDFLKANG